MSVVVTAGKILVKLLNSYPIGSNVNALESISAHRKMSISFDTIFWEFSLRKSFRRRKTKARTFVAEFFILVNN